jgi:hypothetical protein
MHPRLLRLALMASAVSMAIPIASAFGAAFQNGSFETGTSVTDANGVAGQQGTTATGWTLTGNVINIAQSADVPGANSHYMVGTTNGTHAMQMNAGNTTANATISQTFDVTGFAVYSCSFDYGKFGDASHAAGNAIIKVTITGGTITQNTMANTTTAGHSAAGTFAYVNANNVTVTDTSGVLTTSPNNSYALLTAAEIYQTYSFKFTVQGNPGTATITFTDQSDTAGVGFDAGLDNVNVAFFATPEPASLSALALGASALLIRRRRR